MLVKNKENTDYTDATRLTYHIINDTYGYTARIVNIWEFLKLALQIDEFEILTPKNYNNAPFETYLMDRQIDWMEGKDVDFGEVYRKILETGDFTRGEKRLMSEYKIEEILWGIYLAVCNPELKI